MPVACNPDRLPPRNPVQDYLDLLRVMTTRSYALTWRIAKKTCLGGLVGLLGMSLRSLK
jgi:hypothetical protein